MLSHIAHNEDMVRSFIREARLASYLRHENVAQTYDLGRVGETYFIVMELITGRNLREVLRHCGATTGPMPVPIALNILNQICDALHYAHNLCDETGQPLGIIHRDVSPSNVIVSTSGVVKLIDFGIAKASAAGMQTMSGMLKGKFAYMAPEYIAGQLDARADLFAVGVIAHELLTNRPLFAGKDDIDTLTRVRDMRIAPPSQQNRNVPPEIDDIVMTALARDPERRWQHATALRTALTTLTRRLGLVASNTQVIQWLDWAFLQKRRPRSVIEPDTETDASPLGEQPSISIEMRAAEPSVTSDKITLIPDGDPEPPARTPEPPARPSAPRPLPAGQIAAVERSSPLTLLAGRSMRTSGLADPVVAGPTSRDHAPALAPGDFADAAVGLRPAADARELRVRASSTLPVLGAAPPPGRLGSVAPPIAGSGTGAPALRPSSPPHASPFAAAPAPPGSPIGYPAAPAPSPGYPTAPVVPAPNAARSAAPHRAQSAMGSAPPHAPRPATQGHDPRSPGVAVHRPRPSPVLAVLLVILAAATAATAVYFVLPLLT